MTTIEYAGNIWVNIPDNKRSKYNAFIVCKGVSYVEVSEYFYVEHDLEITHAYYVSTEDKGVMLQIDLKKDTIPVSCVTDISNDCLIGHESFADEDNPYGYCKTIILIPINQISDI